MTRACTFVTLICQDAHDPEISNGTSSREELEFAEANRMKPESNSLRFRLW
jgi:hypothetical protein